MNQSKNEAKEQFGKKKNQYTSGDRKSFWKEKCSRTVRDVEGVF